MGSGLIMRLLIICFGEVWLAGSFWKISRLLFESVPCRCGERLFGHSDAGK